jgi:hypothetical protein
MIEIKMKCPDCGLELKANAKTCISCGCPIVYDSGRSSRQSVLTKRKCFGISLCLAAIVCFVICFTRVSNDQYRFYIQHYGECKAGYEESMLTAESYGYGFFRSSYQDIASTYQDLMDSDQKKIWTYRALGSVGLILLGSGIKNIKKRG